MEIIAKLEGSPRGVYTGALGFVMPGGDARFVSVFAHWWLKMKLFMALAGE